MTIRMINAAGNVADVPQTQIEAQAQLGYFELGMVGPTASRPTNGLYRSMPYFDTDLDKLIAWVGGGGGIVGSAATPGFWTDGTGASV